MNAVPRALFAAVAGGVGLFIAFIGLVDAGLIVAKPGTMIGLGDLTAATPALSMLGLLLIASLQAWRVRGAMLLGILLTAAIGWGGGHGPLHAGGLHLKRLVCGRV